MNASWRDIQQMLFFSSFRLSSAELFLRRRITVARPSFDSVYLFKGNMRRSLKKRNEEKITRIGLFDAVHRKVQTVAAESKHATL